MKEVKFKCSMRHHFSRLLRRSQPKFEFCGSPVKFTGPGHRVFAEKVFLNHNEPLIIHCLSGSVSALFLIEYPQRSNFLLLDCGSPSDVSRVEFYLRDVLSQRGADQATGSAITTESCATLSSQPKKQLGLLNLRLAVVSHCHIDHSGGAAGYAKHGVPVAKSLMMNPHYYRGVRGRMERMLEAVFTSYVSQRMGRGANEQPFRECWKWPDFKGEELQDGCSLPFGFDDWCAVHLPGHTTHMIGLYHSLSSTLYAADLFVKIHQKFLPPYPIDYGWAYVHTLQRLRSLTVKCVLLAHGGVIWLGDSDWANIVDTLIEKWESIEKQKVRGGRQGKGVRMFRAASWLRRRVVRIDHEFSPQDLKQTPFPPPAAAQ